MSKPTSVLIISRDAQDYFAQLSGDFGHEIDWHVAEHLDAIPEEALAASVALGEPDLLARVAGRLPALRWTQSTWAGVTPLLDLAASGIAVTGVKDVFGAQMSEYAMAYMLDHALQLPERRQAQAKHEWLPSPTGTLLGKTLGVMGTGSIGTAVARQAATLGMKVVGFNRSGQKNDAFERVFQPASLDEFLGELDYLIGVLPDTPDTDGLLDERALRVLPAGALLINVGRGTLLVEEDLHRVLTSGHLAGAVLDVFRSEPLPAEHSFWSTPRLTITAHVAAQSWPTEIAALFRENLIRYLDKQPLNHQLDPGRGY